VNNGASFSSSLILGNNLGPQILDDSNRRAGHIAVSGSSIYVTWQRLKPVGTGGPIDTIVIGSLDNGATFGNIVSLTRHIADNIGHVNLPGIVSSNNNNVYTLWQDEVSGNYDIMFKRIR
jgi:hypothetical protein